jgi:hypothetical protein
MTAMGKGPASAGPSSDRAAAAHRFAGLGCHIVPAAGKNPGGYLGRGWPGKATRDPGLIDAWWRAWPAANVAVLPGRALLPIDVDDVESFDRFQAARGRAPATPRYLSGGDGGRERLLFAYPGDAALAGVSRAIAPGVQLRHSATTALVCVVPPGRNPDTGRDLQWKIGLDDCALAAIPPGWLDRARETGGQPLTADELAGVQRKGDRHPTLLRIVASLMARRVDPLVVLELALAYNIARCRPPKPESEVAQIVDWAAARELQKRRRR